MAPTRALALALWLGSRLRPGGAATRRVLNGSLSSDVPRFRTGSAVPGAEVTDHAD